MTSELFWAAFAAIGQAVGAIATAAAVIITLWQIRHANKKKLKMRFTDQNMVFSERSDSKYFYINLSVINIGNRNVIIKNWGMRVPEKSKYLFVPDMANPMIRLLQKPLPCTLEPENSVDLVFDLKLFLNNLRGDIEQGTFLMNDKITFFVIDSTGKEYRLKIEKSIKQLLEDNEKNVDVD